MTAQTVHSSDARPPSLPRTQNAVAAALPPADRMEFYQEMGEADETELLSTLRRWWMRAAHLYADPLPEETRAAVEAGLAPGRSALAVLREATAAREAEGR
ncbi:hypothetical protein [Streptomyces sp. RKCA744]|uniref:hypothetical protein n=1 Tax=Streptomyces sp. RKCA744 TaxID=2959340 RepID=UPI0020A0BB89|nr:hypothetical protein [Streptomyces sp. RKCA744]MCO8308785.1 hypothetical protein [Streptomyces sp. RKCA744]